jgi:hypothetical protein
LDDKKKNNGRAFDKTQIILALPRKLLEKIDTNAASEMRNRNNYIVKILTEATQSD